jgi:hypothetical protein
MLISQKFKGLFAKWSGLAQSSPSTWPIRRPEIAREVATHFGHLLVRKSYIEIEQRKGYSKFHTAVKE